MILTNYYEQSDSGQSNSHFSKDELKEAQQIAAVIIDDYVKNWPHVPNAVPNIIGTLAVFATKKIGHFQFRFHPPEEYGGCYQETVSKNIEEFVDALSNEHYEYTIQKHGNGNFIGIKMAKIRKPA